MPFRIIFSGLLVLMLAGCSSSDDSEVKVSQAPASSNDEQKSMPLKAVASTVKAKNSHAVLDTFGVGENVYVRALAVESSNNHLWVGSSVGVLDIDLENRSLVKTLTRDDGLANEYVFAIDIDSQGYKWFGTNGGGMSRYRDGEWKTYFPMHGLADYWIYAFDEMANGDLWIGTWAGANLLKASTGKLETYVKELVNEWVYGVAIDQKQRVWFATEGGVSMLDGDQWSSFTHADGVGASNESNLPISINTGLGTRSRHDLNILSEGRATYNPSYVFCVMVAADETVWAGTWGGGVSYYDGRGWKNLTENDGLAGNIVYSIAQDKSGVFWFGTNKGLSRFDGQTWQTFNRHNGLLGNSVYSVISTPDGEIWAGTKGGVVRIGRKMDENK
ncbi:MAG: regulator [Gammaproteobacteria bacterium]|nr:regulator [Gammaproteobacteria bacterium]